MSETESRAVARPSPPIITQMSFGDMRALAATIAKSNLFGIKTADQALTLMAIAQAEGRHPALAARDYDIIQGRPSKKAEAMLRDFLAGGGRVEWHELTDNAADATFAHPAGGTVRIRWDHERAKQAGLGGKDMWRKFPRQMLRSRTVSEGVRTVCPSATDGMYVPEEVRDFAHEPIDVTPPKAEPASVLEHEEEQDRRSDEALDKVARATAAAGTMAFRTWWQHELTRGQRDELRPAAAEYQAIATQADEWAARSQQAEREPGDDRDEDNRDPGLF